MRALVVGGGRRAIALTRSLAADGHAIRVVTRDPERRRAEIEAAGGECWPGDPDRIGTLRYALENVTILLWLLASAGGEDAERVAALHGSRLRMMLEKVTDSTVRGVIYETTGRLPEDVIAAGVAEVREAKRMNEIPYRLLGADPADEGAWVSEARAAVDELLATDR